MTQSLREKIRKKSRLLHRVIDLKFIWVVIRKVQCYRRDCGCVVFSGHDGHQGALTSIACNKEGTLALTGSVDGQAKLFNTSTGKVRRVTSAAPSVFLPVTLYC